MLFFEDTNFDKSDNVIFLELFNEFDNVMQEFEVLNEDFLNEGFIDTIKKWIASIINFFKKIWNKFFGLFSKKQNNVEKDVKESIVTDKKIKEVKKEVVKAEIKSSIKFKEPSTRINSLGALDVGMACVKWKNTLETIIDGINASLNITQLEHQGLNRASIEIKYAIKNTDAELSNNTYVEVEEIPRYIKENLSYLEDIEDKTKNFRHLLNSRIGALYDENNENRVKTSRMSSWDLRKSASQAKNAAFKSRIERIISVCRQLMQTIIEKNLKFANEIEKANNTLKNIQDKYYSDLKIYQESLSQ